MKNEHKIILGGLIVVAITLVMGIALSYLMSDQIKSLAIENYETTNSAFLSSSANSFLSKNDFTPENFPEKKIVFENFFPTNKI